MSLGGKASKQKTKETQVAELDPIARAALTDIIGGSRQLFESGAPLFAPTDPATIAGLQAQQDRPISPFIPAAAQQLGQTLGGGFLGQFQPAQTAAQQNLARTLGGDFLGAADPALGAIEERILGAVGRDVGQRFTAAGRTAGAPGEQAAFGREVTQELAPFLFQNLQQERGRQLQAAQLAQQGFLGERAGQLGAFGAIPGVEAALGTQEQRLLDVGEQIRAINQQQFDEPFLRFERFANPLLAAAGGFPVSLTREATAKGIQAGGKLSLF